MSIYILAHRFTELLFGSPSKTIIGFNRPTTGTRGYIIRKTVKNSLFENTTIKTFYRINLNYLYSSQPL